ncbi:MAG: hypothetical protein ABUK01_05745 [Leptospirales bacterium]
MRKTDPSINTTGASPAYRGYRLQSLYVLDRVLNSTTEDIQIRPEGYEDVDILDTYGSLLEAVQVKSYEILTFSNLGSSKSQKPFLKRAALLYKKYPDAKIKLVNFGRFGPEMTKAWDGKHLHLDDTISKKLKEKHDLNNDEITLIHSKLELKELAENLLTESVYQKIKQSVAGIDPAHAFDLLNFWIYRLSEESKTMDKTDVIDKINSIGRSLTERHHYLKQWFTSIQPIEPNKNFDIQSHKESLESEFYAGASARYEHILAGIDFLRGDLLNEIDEKLNRSRILIIHAASGQGKTTLAYRYLHDYYPAQWKYKIEIIENSSHALEIAAALNAHASSLNAPIAIYIDVRPANTFWIELVRQLHQYSYLKVLVTIREEDYKRSSLPGYEISFEEMELNFNHKEGELIYNRAMDAKVSNRFLDFQAAWAQFGEQGPLLEFVYLLTQTSSLAKRLEEQVTNIYKEVSGQGTSKSKWKILCYCAAATAYESKIETVRLYDLIDDTGLAGFAFAELEEEYLIKLSDEGSYIEGLHPIRSAILLEIILRKGQIERVALLKKTIALIHEPNLEQFILSAFYAQTKSEQEEFTEFLISFYPKTWCGSGCLIRSINWICVYQYIQLNKDLFAEVEAYWSGGWNQFVLNIDFMDVLDKKHPFDEKMLFGKQKKQEIDLFRRRQSSIHNMFQNSRKWLQNIGKPENEPQTYTDWQGVSDVLFWSGWYKVQNGCLNWVTLNQLNHFVQHHDLQIISDVLIALYQIDIKLYKKCIKNNDTNIQELFAGEFGVFKIKKKAETIKIHFVPEAASEQKIKQDDNLIHSITMNAIFALRSIYQDFKYYASQGYGVTIKSLGIDHDDTVKEIPFHRLHLEKTVRINQYARNLIEYMFRPNGWQEYSESVIQTRKAILEELISLRTGIAKFFQKKRGFDLINYCRSNMKLDTLAKKIDHLPGLPESCIDPWGYKSETDADAGDEMNQGMSKQVLFLLKYKTFLEKQKEYFTGIRNFSQQSFSVLVTISLTGHLKDNDPKKEQALSDIKAKGFNVENMDLSTRNLWNSLTGLLEYQQEFKEYFNFIVPVDQLSKLERKEKSILFEIWLVWYNFVNKPGQIIMNFDRYLQKRKRELKNDIDEKVDKVLKDENEYITERIQTDLRWETDSTLWLKVNFDSPTDYYSVVEEVLEQFKLSFGKREVNSIEDYFMEYYYKKVVLIPLVSGQLINLNIYVFSFEFFFYETESYMNPLIHFAPKQTDDERIKSLGLSIWDSEDVKFANQLADNLALVRFWFLQLADVAFIWENTKNLQARKVEEKLMEMKKKELEEYVSKLGDAFTYLRTKADSVVEADYEKHNCLLVCYDAMIDFVQNVFMTIPESEKIEGKTILQIAEKFKDYEFTHEEMRLNWIKDVLDNFGD